MIRIKSLCRQAIDFHHWLKYSAHLCLMANRMWDVAGIILKGVCRSDREVDAEIARWGTSSRGCGLLMHARKSAPE